MLLNEETVDVVNRFGYLEGDKGRDIIAVLF